jgi:hypothetical protein
MGKKTVRVAAMALTGVAGGLAAAAPAAPAQATANYQILIWASPRILNNIQVCGKNQNNVFTCGSAQPDGWVFPSFGHSNLFYINNWWWKGHIAIWWSAHHGQSWNQCNVQSLPHSQGSWAVASVAFGHPKC